jgi:hypothetical protein
VVELLDDEGRRQPIEARSAAITGTLDGLVATGQAPVATADVPPERCA